MTDTIPHRPGRNEPCHCGSGKKYKHCHLAADEEEDRAARAKQASEAAPPAPEEEPPAPQAVPPPRASNQPWKRAAQNARGGARRITTPRKAG